MNIMIKYVINNFVWFFQWIKSLLIDKELYMTNKFYVQTHIYFNFDEKYIF